VRANRIPPAFDANVRGGVARPVAVGAAHITSPRLKRRCGRTEPPDTFTLHRRAPFRFFGARLQRAAITQVCLRRSPAAVESARFTRCAFTVLFAGRAVCTGYVTLDGSNYRRCKATAAGRMSRRRPCVRHAFGRSRSHDLRTNDC